MLDEMMEDQDALKEVGDLGTVSLFRGNPESSI